MLVVATRKTKKQPKRTGRAVHIWIEPELRERLDDFVSRLQPKPTHTSVVSLAIEEYLDRNESRLPPAPEANP
jgi:predicted DNA-binding protein